MKAANLGEMAALKTQVEDLLYTAMVRGNTISEGLGHCQLYLTPKQVGYLIGAKLSKLEDSIPHHILHLQESSLQIGGETIWVQFLDTQGIDRGYKAKYMSSILNDEVTRKPYFAELKGKLGKGQSLFNGYDDDLMSFIWVKNSELYRLYQQIAIASFQKASGFRVHRAQDTIYPSLFAELAPKIRQGMLLTKRKNQATFELFNVSSFKKSADNLTYSICAPQSDLAPEERLIRYKTRMWVYAKHHQLRLEIKQTTNELTLDETSYRNWLKIIDLELGRSKKTFKVDTAFSEYISDFGSFYIHYPESRKACSVASVLNADLKENLFHYDEKIQPNIVYIEKEEYIEWLKKKGTCLDAIQIPIPPAQTKYIKQLHKLRYNPVVEYKTKLISATWTVLKETIDSPELLNAITLGLETKNTILEQQEFKEEEKLDLFKRQQFRQQLGRGVLGIEPTSITPYVNAATMNRINHYCRVVSEHILTLGYSRKELEKIIKQFIYSINVSPNIFFDAEKDTIILKSGQYQVELFDLHPEGVPKNHCRLISILSAEILCALADFVFYNTYLEVQEQVIAQKAPTTPVIEPITTPAEHEPKSLVTTKIRKAQKNNSTDQLLKTRPDIIVQAMSTQGYTYAAPSGIEGAGNGLYVKGPVKLKKGQIITWYNGELINTSDITPDTDQTHIISLEGYASKNSPLIQCDPSRTKHKGQGDFANHSTTPNVTRKTVYYAGLPVAVVLVYIGEPFELEENESYEMVFNYGVNAARSIHHIQGNMDFTPQIIRHNGKRKHEQEGNEDSSPQKNENNPEPTFESKRSQNDRRLSPKFFAQLPTENPTPEAAAETTKTSGMILGAD